MNSKITLIIQIKCFESFVDKNPSGFNLQDIFNNDDKNSFIQNHYLEEIFPYVEFFISSNSNNTQSLPFNIHSEQCPKFVNGEQYSKVQNSEQYSNFLNNKPYSKVPNIEHSKISNSEQCLKVLDFKNLETKNFDFCYYDKLSQGEIINFSASKNSRYLEPNDKISKNLESNIQVSKSLESNNQGSKNLESNNITIPYFKSSKLPLPCFHESSTPSSSESKETPNKEFNTQETQTETFTLDVVEGKDKNVWKSKLVLCELDMFVEPKFDLFNDSIGGSFKNNSSANSYKSENESEQNEVEENINSPAENPWEPRLCYEVDISPQQDNIGYGSFKVSFENEKNVRKNIFKCIEVENKQFKGHFSTNREPKELSFELNLDSKIQKDIDKIDVKKENTQIHQNKNNEDHFELNSNMSLDLKEMNKNNKSNNDINYKKENKYTSHSLLDINQSTKNERNSSYNSYDSVNQSQNSPKYSTNEDKSIDYQIQNKFEQTITSLSTITKDIEKNQLHNQPEPELLSTQSFIFNPLDPLYLNLFVNYDGHQIGQLKMDVNIN